MRQHWKLNSLLMEILIAVLFFALCSGVVLNTMVASRTQSIRAGEVTAMLSEVQSLADQLYTADDRTAMLLEKGFAAQESGGYLLEGESGSLSVTLREEDAETGVLRLADIHAVTASGEAIDFTSTRFVPEEVR